MAIHAFTNTTKNETPRTPVTSAIWHNTKTGVCVYPRYSQGSPCHGQVPRSSSATATQMAAMEIHRSNGKWKMENGKWEEGRSTEGAFFLFPFSIFLFPFSMPCPPTARIITPAAAQYSP